MAGMEDEREKQGGASAAIYSIVTVLVVLPILYAISSGPAFYLFRLAGLPTRTWDAVYMPIRVVAVFFPPFNRFLVWYVNLWL